jgi:ubiquinone/menaquinone biosynthesis C-methylase UbiE
LNPFVKARAGGRSVSSYPLPSNDDERARLATQAKMMNPLTGRLFTAAGLAPGMRVLDVGSGAGDVALLAREFVGDQGSVVGYDQDGAQAAHAQRRAEEAGFSNVRIVQAGTDTFQSEAPFDAAVGRFTLMYHPDMNAALSAIARHVRPGGVLAFHEMHYRDNPEAWPQVWPPLQGSGFQDKLHTIIRTMAASGVNMFAGTALVSSLSRFGDVHAWAEQTVMFGPNAVEAPLSLLRSILPRAEALGVIGPGEIDVESMRREAREHAMSCMPVAISPSQVLAWARLK